MTYKIECADVLDWAASYDGPKFHAILCDPPYEYAFMNRRWDSTGITYQADTWAALAEHLHDGGFLMAFGGARTWHRLAVAMEDAGLRIHPSIFCWTYGSGFPKATRLDTQIDRGAGATRQIVGDNPNARPNSDARHKELPAGIYGGGNGTDHAPKLTAPATPLAAAWSGHRYGLQALKPAVEPVIVAQKPYSGKPVDCITATGAGALWVDGGRIGTEVETWPKSRAFAPGSAIPGYSGYTQPTGPMPSGRWPANFALVHAPGCRRVGTERVRGTGTAGIESGKGQWFGNGPGFLDAPQTYADADGLETIAAWDCVPDCPARRLGEQSGVSRSNQRPPTGKPKYTGSSMDSVAMRASTTLDTTQRGHNDSGTCARFFYQASWQHEVAEQLAAADTVRYQAKAARSERDAGLEGMVGHDATALTGRKADSPGLMRDSHGGNSGNPYKGSAPVKSNARNIHPTCKPIDLIRWLATLLLPPAEYAPRRILVPFCGSGSEMIGCGLAGWDEIVGVELMPEYAEIAEARLAHWLQNVQLELI